MRREGVLSGASLDTQPMRSLTSHDGSRPATLDGSFRTSRDGNQPEILVSNFDNSLDGNLQAERGHNSSSDLSAAAQPFLPNGAATESFLPDDAAFVSQLASSARKHCEWVESLRPHITRSDSHPVTSATQAHAEPETAHLNFLFWPPDAHADSNPASLAET